MLTHLISRFGVCWGQCGDRQSLFQEMDDLEPEENGHDPDFKPAEPE